MTDENNDRLDHDDREEDIISLAGHQVVFSGRRIRFDPLSPSSETDICLENENDSNGEVSAARHESLDERDENESEHATAGYEKSLSHDVDDSSNANPFVLDFLSNPESDSPNAQSFAAALQSVFSEHDELSLTVFEETDEDEEDDEEVANEFDELSLEEQYQQDEEERNRENLDEGIRQNDAQLLYELGEKYGRTSSGRIEESQHVEINPTSLLESMLFVGDRDNRPLLLSKAVALMRDVSEEEAIEAISDLNRRYEKNGTPYRIIPDGAGWRMKLSAPFEPVRDRFFGKSRQFRLSQKQIEVLALVAYRQPISTAEILESRPASASILAQLVKRNLISQEKRVIDHKSVSYFRTTERFLSVFKIASLDDLPIVDEVDYR